MNIILEGDQGIFGLNLVSFPPVDLNKNIFKQLQFFDQLDAMEAILDVGKGCRT